MASDVLISVSSQDAYAKSKQTHIHFPSTLTLANAQTFVSGYLPKWDALSGSFVTGVTITLPLTYTGLGLKTVATSGVSALVAARFSFDAGVRLAYGVDVPGVLPKYWTGKKDLAESGGTDLADFAAAYVAGISGQNPTNGSGEDLLSLLKKSRVVHTK